MTQILVSVVICTYNREKYLARCLESIKKQTHTNYEIIVVNGPSTDETEALLSMYPDIKKIPQKSLNGLSFARNLGIRAARGEIIAFIDDDAIADRFWLEYLVEGFKDSSVGGVGGPVFDITGHWHQFKCGYISKAGIPTFLNEKDPEYNNPDGPYFNYIMGTNSSFRKNILFEIGLFDENYRYYLDETDVCVNIIKKGYKIKHIDSAVVLHEMAESHNRTSPYDINYTEILKNTIYFILKNFGSEKRSHTLFPVSAVWYWIKIDMIHFRYHRITFKQFVTILINILIGLVRGYRLGLQTNAIFRQRSRL
jgi:glycosyltransferase involved in cell wall biosynthesis